MRFGPQFIAGRKLIVLIVIVRRFVSMPNISAEVTQIDADLIILRVSNIKSEIKVDEFENICLEI